MKIPDLISPIIGHRVWRWDATGLRSLNGKPWSPRQPLEAKCGVGNAHDAHEPPHLDCTCGVYAAKNLEHLRQLGYEGRGICGEVHLWGTVVEHELGWRAQHAYPKSLVLPPDLIPSDTKEMEVRLKTLAEYGADVFILGGGRKIPLCRRGSGFDTAGLDYLIGKRTEYYARRQRDRTLMKGDRVAVFGRGIAVVEHADETEVEALLGNKTILRMRRNDIDWNRQNMRWEAEVPAPYSGAKRHFEPKSITSCLPTNRSESERICVALAPIRTAVGISVIRTRVLKSFQIRTFTWRIADRRLAGTHSTAFT